MPNIQPLLQIQKGIDILTEHQASKGSIKRNVLTPDQIKRLTDIGINTTAAAAARMWNEEHPDSPPVSEDEARKADHKKKKLQKITSGKLVSQLAKLAFCNKMNTMDQCGCNLNVIPVLFC